MDELTYSSLLSHLERDIQKPKPKDEHYRKTAYIGHFIGKHDSDLVIKLSDPIEVRQLKLARSGNISSQLNSYTKTSVAQLKNKLDELNIPEEGRTWKKVPDLSLIHI